MTVPLPPLPPLFGGGDLPHHPGGRRIDELLAEEHEWVRALCRQLIEAGADADAGDAADADAAAAAGARRRRDALDVLAATLTRHLSAEAQYLYPAVRAAVPDGDAAADRAIEADRALLRALRRLCGTAPADPRFAGLAAEVADRIDRHVEVTDRRLLPGLSAVATTEELIRLGNRAEVAEEAAPTRPHPNTPATPPWNKVVDPAVGVVDRLRDLVTGRPTVAEPPEQR